MVTISQFIFLHSKVVTNYYEDDCGQTPSGWFCELHTIVVVNSKIKRVHEIITSANTTRIRMFKINHITYSKRNELNKLKHN